MPVPEGIPCPGPKKAGRPWLGRRWSPTEPAEGSTPAAMSCWVNANEVYADEADEPQLLQAERVGRAGRDKVRETSVRRIDDMATTHGSTGSEA